MGDDNGNTQTDSGGCSHYRRNCDVLAPCCQRYFCCHLCHDEHFAMNFADADACSIEMKVTDQRIQSCAYICLPDCGGATHCRLSPMELTPRGPACRAQRRVALGATWSKKLGARYVLSSKASEVRARDVGRSLPSTSARPASYSVQCVCSTTSLPASVALRHIREFLGQTSDR